MTHAALSLLPSWNPKWIAIFGIEVLKDERDIVVLLRERISRTKQHTFPMSLSGVSLVTFALRDAAKKIQDIF
jgi:hypothetical protein